MPKRKITKHLFILQFTTENFQLLMHLTSLPGIDLDIRDKNNKTFLHLASETIANEPIANYLLSLNRIQINAKEEKGRTILHYACERKSLDLIKNLIKRPELDFTATDSKGMNLSCTLHANQPIVSASFDSLYH